MKKLLFIFIFLFSFVAGNTLAEEAEYSAVVMDTSGEIFVKRDSEKGKEYFLEIGALLYPGDSVKISEGAHLTIKYIESGQVEEWPGKKKFTVGRAETSGIQSGVEIKSAKIKLPEWQQPEHIGGDVAASCETPVGSPGGWTESGEFE